MWEQRIKKLKKRWTSKILVETYEFFKEYEQNKIIEKAPFDEVPKKTWSNSLSPTLTSAKGR